MLNDSKLSSDVVRVLYHSAASELGGAVFSLLNLIRNLDRELYKPVVLVSTDESEEFCRELSLLNVEQIRLDIRVNSWVSASSPIRLEHRSRMLHRLKAPGRFIRHISNAVRLARLIQARHIDIVHTNDENLLDGALGALLARRPHVWHIRSRLGRDGFLTHWLGLNFALKLIHVLSSTIIVNSRATLAPWRKAALDGKVVMIHNGVDTEIFKRRQGKLRSEYKLSCDTPIVAMISTNPQFDGLHHFIEAAICFSRIQPQSHFFLIGKTETCDEEYLLQQKQKLIDHNLERQFTFAGFRRDLPGLYPDIDVLLEPMMNGSWSRVVLEAMASGVPIIAVEADLTSDFLKHGETGILVRNPQELGPVLVDVFADREALRLMAKKARQQVLEFFSDTRCANRVMKVYCSCLQGSYRKAVGDDVDQKNKKNCGREHPF